eukprot:gene13628-16044_t
MAGTISEPDVQALIKLATWSHLGRETIFYDRFRKGLEIKGGRIKFGGYSGFLPPQASLNMLASPGSMIIPELYKIHIYEQGGHFDTHTDTPHSSNHIGKLFMTMGSDYQGGEFIVQCGDETKTVKLDINGPNQWIMFYNDCRHRVANVTSGVRVVMQFDLYQEVSSDIGYKWLNVGGSEDQYEDYDAKDTDDESSEVMETMVNSQKETQRLLCKMESTMKRVEGHNLAIMLKHNYYHSVASGELENIDALVWQQVKINHPDCYIAPMIIFTKKPKYSIIIDSVEAQVFGLDTGVTIVTGLGCDQPVGIYLEHNGKHSRRTRYGTTCIVVPNCDVVE